MNRFGHGNGHSNFRWTCTETTVSSFLALINGLFDPPDEDDNKGEVDDDDDDRFEYGLTFSK